MKDNDSQQDGQPSSADGGNPLKTLKDFAEGDWNTPVNCGTIRNEAIRQVVALYEDVDNSPSVAHSYGAIIWINKFFNITEADLK